MEYRRGLFLEEGPRLGRGSFFLPFFRKRFIQDLNVYKNIRR